VSHACTTRRTAKLNFPNEVPDRPDPDTVLKLDNMVGLALGTSGEDEARA